MFQKPFRVKSNVQMKVSEKKAFKMTLLKQFYKLTEEKLSCLFGSKDIFNVVKAVTHCNKSIQIYLVQKQPLFFVIDNDIYPTVYTLWQVPSMVASLTVHGTVFKRLTAGADLMLPGVLVPENVDGPLKYGDIINGECVGVNTIENRAPLAVGTALLSSSDMFNSGGKGKCVKILHFFGDKLCSMEGCQVAQAPPDLGLPEWLLPKEIIGEQLNTEDESNEPVSAVILDEDPVINEECQVPENTSNEVNEVEEMDKLFKYCLLKVIKRFKKCDIPMLSSKLSVLIKEVCPLGKSLDFKKSSYKKFGAFIKQMEKEGFITVVEKPKGVLTITAVNMAHPDLKNFVIDSDDYFVEEKSAEPVTGVSVCEDFTISAASLPIFQSSGFSKGDIIKHSELRRCIVNYVKINNLLDKSDGRFIIPNEELSKIVKSTNPQTWEDIVLKLTSSMNTCFKITSAEGNETKGKGKIQNIIISVATRSGNKKVTLIDNLELYGINLNDFGKECQKGVAASTSISKPPGKKHNQLLVQGNQVLFVGNLLMEKYKVPKKYIKGLELAPKKK